MLLLRLTELLCIASERGDDVALVCSITLPNLLASPRTLGHAYVDAEYREGERERELSIGRVRQRGP